MEWNNMILKKLSILAKRSGETTLFYGKDQKKIVLKKGQSMELSW
jgi:hypothetical protein